MSAQDLELMKPLFLAIPSADVMRPTGPVNRLASNALSVVTWLRKNDRLSRLSGLRLPPEVDVLLERAAGALLTAQAIWTGIRDNEDNPERAALRDQADEELDRLVEITEHFFEEAGIAPPSMRHLNRSADSAEAGDFELLAFIIRQHPDVFQAGDRFDSTSLAEEAEAWSKKLSAAATSISSQRSPAESKELRDRGYTYIHKLLRRIRSAASIGLGATSPDFKELRAID